MKADWRRTMRLYGGDKDMRLALAEQAIRRYEREASALRSEKGEDPRAAALAVAAAIIELEGRNASPEDFLSDAADFLATLARFGFRVSRSL